MRDLNRLLLAKGNGNRFLPLRLRESPTNRFFFAWKKKRRRCFLCPLVSGGRDNFWQRLDTPIFSHRRRRRRGRESTLTAGASVIAHVAFGRVVVVVLVVDVVVVVGIMPNVAH